MTTTEAIKLLEMFRAGGVGRDEVLRKFQAAPVADLGFAQVDTHRALRRGFPEVIFGAGKTPDQVVRIAAKLFACEQRVLVTRVAPEHARKLRRKFKRAVYHELARCVTIESKPLPKRPGTITVVCAGVKSILDVPATLERLETLGVTVVGYRTLRFPGFYVADSGHDLDWAVSEPEEIAVVMRAADRLGLANAIVIANPVPVEHQLDPETHDALLADALAAADRDGIHGKAVTPFLLDHLYLASGGASLEANIWAVRNNVALAARIARAWAETDE